VATCIVVKKFDEVDVAPRFKQTMAWLTSCQHLYSTLSTRIFIFIRVEEYKCAAR
jgi:hypothetical protein